MPADSNGDGVTDLFMYRTSTGDFYRVLFGANGPVIDAVRWSTGFTVRKGDFNGDRRDDVFVYNRATGSWWMIMNAPDGTYRYYGGGWGPGWDVLVSDFNGDGTSDLLLYNSAAGVLAQATTIGPGNFDVKWISVGSGFTLIGHRMSVF
jgi:hypothetical protein